MRESLEVPRGNDRGDSSGDVTEERVREALALYRAVDEVLSGKYGPEILKEQMLRVLTYVGRATSDREMVAVVDTFIRRYTS